MKIGDELSVSSPELGMVRARIVYIHPLHRFVTAAVATRSYGDILESFHLGRREKTSLLNVADEGLGRAPKAFSGQSFDSPEKREKCFGCRHRDCINCIGTVTAADKK